MKSRSLYLNILPVFICMVCSPWPGIAGEITPRLHAELSRAQNAPIPVIVTLHDQLDLQAFVRERGPVGKLSRDERKAYRVRLVESLKRRAELSQIELRGFLQGRAGGRIKHLWHINSLAFEATPELIEQLAARPEVAGISYDRPVTKPVVTPRTAAQVMPLVDSNGNAIEDNLELVGAAPLWDLGLTGLGSTVAIIDSGVDLDHPDLVNRWRGGGRAGWLNAVAENCDDLQINCVTACDTNTTEPCDFIDNGGVAHGTGVAGVAVGGSASGTAIGVAPDAEWIAAKIFDSQDGSSISVISEAFAWLLDPDGNPATDDAPDVANASWGFDPNDCILSFRNDVQVLQAAGIALSFSAGNGGPAEATSVSPANYPESFAVGSVGVQSGPQTVDYSLISAFSGRGPSACGPELYPDVVAPGLFILTTDIFQAPNPFAYIEISGTSFAAPQVAGVIAQLLGIGGFSGASVEVLYQALAESATGLGPAGPDNIYGNGLLNAALAYNRLLPPLPVAISPANGSNDLPLEVTLGWSQPADRFGSPVTNQLLLATDPGFTELVPTTASAPGAGATDRKVLLGVAGLLLLPLGLLRRPLNRRLAWGLLVILLTLGLLSCGGGGGGDGVVEPPPPVAPQTQTVSGLSPGTTYFWKVTAQTDRGGPLSESAVFSFTTAP